MTISQRFSRLSTSPSQSQTQDSCSYYPIEILKEGAREPGALVEVSARLAEACIEDDRTLATIDLTVISAIYKPDASLKISQALLGVQVLSLDPDDLEVKDHSPKYEAPKRSYTRSGKSTQTASTTETTQATQTRTVAVSTNAAISKSTLFSIAGTYTKAYSYLQASAATDTESTEEGVSVTLVCRPQLQV